MGGHFRDTHYDHGVDHRRCKCIGETKTVKMPKRKFVSCDRMWCYTDSACCYKTVDTDCCEVCEHEKVSFFCYDCSLKSFTPMVESRCAECFQVWFKKAVNQKPSFNSKYPSVLKCFNDSSYMDFLMKQSWFQYKHEKTLYQVYLKCKEANEA